MNQLEPFKKICYDALNSGNPDAHEEALKKILWMIDKEEENMKLRFEYYKMLRP
jgi:hypothetical protein